MVTGSTVVETWPHNPKAEGLGPATADTERERERKKERERERERKRESEREKWQKVWCQKEIWSTIDRY